MTATCIAVRDKIWECRMSTTAQNYTKLHEKCPDLPKSVPKFFQIKNLGNGAASMAPTAITNFQISFIVDIILHKILPLFNLFLATPLTQVYMFFP